MTFFRVGFFFLKATSAALMSSFEGNVYGCFQLVCTALLKYTLCGNLAQVKTRSETRE